jgi:glycerate 2-kinase
LTARALSRCFAAERHAEGGLHYLLAAGKAADSMAAAAIAHLGDLPGSRGPRSDHLLNGLIVAPTTAPAPDPRFQRVVGGHPVPTGGSEDAGRRALALAHALSSDDHLLVLLSGGASSLMAVPADGLTLDDKRHTTAALLGAGADIHALNTVRKHLSAIKGGWLAAATRAACDVLVVSDVVDDDLSVIASGPTVADASRFDEALDILRRFGGEDRFPRAVVQRLRDGAAGRVPETPKPGDARLGRARSTVIGSRRDAMDGALAEATGRGYHAIRIDDPVVGEARVTAASHMRAAIALAAGARRPTCIVSSGETTVRVRGQGRGGRNQEFVLAAAELLDQIAAPGAVASAGTDGVDGPTDAAGAYADSTTIDRALAEGKPPDRYLDDNNSYAFFEALGDLINTGPTGTNVGDLQVILLA